MKTEGGKADAPTISPTQLKLASKSKGLRRLYRFLLGILMPTFAFVAPRWNRRFMRAIARFLAASFWKVRPKYERAVRRNIAQVLGVSPEDPRTRKLAYQMHYNHAYFWIDLFAFAGSEEEEIERHIAWVEREEIIVDAHAAGNGVILATAHVGNWELGGLTMGKRNLPVTVVYARDRFEEIERFRESARNTGGVKQLAVSDSRFSALPLVAALRRGEIVALQVDRDWNDRGIAVPFFGRPAFFPTGPVVLARATGAPIVFCLILHLPGLQYGIRFDGPLELVRTDDKEADIQENVRRVAAQVESYVRDHVEQWYCYYPLWDDAEARMRSSQAS